MQTHIKFCHLNKIAYLQLQILCDKFNIDYEGARAEYDIMTNIMHQEYSNLSSREMMETTALKLGDLIPKMAELAVVALVLPVSTAGKFYRLHFPKFRSSSVRFFNIIIN